MIRLFINWLGRLGAKDVLLVVSAAVVGLALIGFMRDPFGLRRARQERLEDRAEAAEQTAQAKALEATGERWTTQRVDALSRRVSAAQGVTTDLWVEAAKAVDGAEPLEPARAVRLAAHDRELCRLAALDGCGKAE